MATLGTYHAKRNFSKTPEPRGKVAASGKKLHYFIQRHAATRLHYDFRLELDGVLVSWAVPKGPSLDPHDRRLAVHVEDHPLDYGTFEGVIPKGNYGAGTVVLWDRGTWSPDMEPHQALRKGELKFHLDGEKLHGGWVLVKLKGRGDDEDNWLLIKERDDAVREEDITVTRPESVAKNHRDVSLPDVDFQLAKRVEVPPTGKGWIFEIKLDGYRVMASVAGGRATLKTRGGHDWTHRFGRVARALEAIPATGLILDGEMVILDKRGVSSFGRLAEGLGKGDDQAIVYQAFDLLWIDGEDLRREPLVARKARLVKLLTGVRGPIRYLEHVEGHGDAFFQSTCSLGLEGSIAKRGDRPYVSGRGDEWRKIKCQERQELVIVGWSDPKGSRTGFGALLLGTRRDGALRYAGKVGTGFSGEVITRVHARLVTLARSKPAVVDPPAGAEGRNAHWVEPSLVAGVHFTGWTAAGRVRHATFQGIREDKAAEEVEMETVTHGETSHVEHSRSPRRRPGANAPAKAPPEPKKRRSTASPPDLAGVKISSADRVIDTTSGQTKGDLAVYYARVADRLLSGVADRPLAVVRCPAGAGKVCFFQKHLGEGFPDGVDSIPIEESEGVQQTIVIHDVKGLLGLVQMGVIEIHPWGSRADDVEKPDRVIFDFDPDPKLPFSAVVEGALEARALLEEIGLRSFVRTTGGKGLHVVAPIQRRLGWDEVKAFTHGVAEALVARRPDRYTSVSSKAKRTGKIFVDYLRNGRGATAVASWVVRARPGLPVAVPITWEELETLKGGGVFGIAEAVERASAPDPWADFEVLRQSISAAARKTYTS